MRALLAHYWQAQVDEAAASIMLTDWMSILSDFGPDEIDAAAKDWLRSNPSRRPTPGNISDMIVIARTARRKAAQRPEPPPPPRSHPDAKERARIAAEALAAADNRRKVQ